MTTKKAEQVYCWKSEESTHIYTGVASAPVSSIRLISPEVCFPMAVCLRKNLEGRKKKKKKHIFKREYADISCLWEKYIESRRSQRARDSFCKMCKPKIPSVILWLSTTIRATALCCMMTSEQLIGLTSLWSSQVKARAESGLMIPSFWRWDNELEIMN